MPTFVTESLYYIELSLSAGGLIYIKPTSIVSIKPLTNTSEIALTNGNVIQVKESFNVIKNRIRKL